MVRQQDQSFKSNSSSPRFSNKAKPKQIATDYIEAIPLNSQQNITNKNELELSETKSR